MEFYEELHVKKPERESGSLSYAIELEKNPTMHYKSLDPLYALLFELLIISLLQYILPLYLFIYLCVYIYMHAI